MDENCLFGKKISSEFYITQELGSALLVRQCSLINFQTHENIQSNTCTSAVSCLCFFQFIILVCFLVSFYRTPLSFSPPFSLPHLTVMTSYSQRVPPEAFFIFCIIQQSPFGLVTDLSFPFIESSLQHVIIIPFFFFFGICVLYFLTLVDTQKDLFILLT